ncbi:MAG: hypothetical protein KFF73_14900 [Cyclobacteriaceae bacterium]|nr:hypothetical protein [Cyclobacteriaceae bacterium]
MERRRFIARFTRWTFAGGLFSLSGLLIYRREKADGESCDFLPACTHCSLFAGCSNPLKKIRPENGKENKI